MTTLTIWRFDSPDGARAASRRVEELARERLVVVHDAAVVFWPPDRKRPKLRQLHDLTGRGALSGAFWGMLFGLLFLMPVAGAAIGAAAGAAGGAMSDVGIDDDLIRRIRERLSPGTSALFLLTSEAVIDRIKDVFADDPPELIFTSLTSDQEEALREIFANEEALS